MENFKFNEELLKEGYEFLANNKGNGAYVVIKDGDLIDDCKADFKNLNDYFTELNANEIELRNEIERLQDSDYIARYARENYSYSKNGEYILKLKSEDKKEENKKSFEINIDYNYIVYAGVAILIIIIIHIVRKRK